MRSEDALKHCCHHLNTKGKIALEQCYYTIHYLFISCMRSISILTADLDPLSHSHTGHKHTLTQGLPREP